MEYTFEQQQELNRIRDAAMGMACNGLTTEELNELSPNLLRAAPGLYEVCKQALVKLSETSSMRDRMEARKSLKRAIAEVEKG